MSKAGQRAWYVAGPVNGTEERHALARALGALFIQGHSVIAPALDPAPTESVDDLAEAMSADFDSLASASRLITLPGSAALWEVAAALALGVPVTPLSDVLAERIPA